MQRVRKRQLQPGEHRTSPSLIGSSTNRPEDAVFVPPVPELMIPALEDLERFMNEPPDLPMLAQCGLIHYQFETIHPFLDGNGRLGRLLVVIFLANRGVLTTPLLYLSLYIEQHRTEYYDRLQMVRGVDGLEEWLQFFPTAVTVQADDALERAERLTDLRESYRAGLSQTRSHAWEVVDLAFENPIITVDTVQRRLGVSQPGASKLIHQLEAKQWLRSLGR